MLRSEAKFSFKNLDPISYLKNFNNMVENDHKQSLIANPRRKELKTVSLNKFPLPAFYQNMEGIFETSSRKKAESVKNQRSSKQMEEEQFMKKHNDFMRKVLTKFIKHNEERQGLFEKDKIFQLRSHQLKDHRRTLSQAKNQRKKEKSQFNNPEINQSEPALATKGSTCNVQEHSRAEPANILPQLKPRKKKEKFKIRRDSQVQQILLARKLTNSTPASSVHKNKQVDEHMDFKQGIIALQKAQANVQESFSSKAQRQIADFDRNMNMQVHAIKYYNFWKQRPANEEEETSQHINKEESITEYAESKVTLERYRSR